ncbi:ComEC/Rec2 family competence protein [Sphingomonas sp. MMS24-JH45]
MRGYGRGSGRGTRNGGGEWRGLGSLLLTGFLVEAALLPIAAYHFHKAGIYGALANTVAIPLTTFVVMPAEAGALLLDAAGIGAPLWWVAGQGLALLLCGSRGQWRRHRAPWRRCRGCRRGRSRCA